MTSLDATQVSRSCPRTDALAELRGHLDRPPQAAFSKVPELARRLSLPEIEVEAALDWLLADGLEVKV